MASKKTTTTSSRSSKTTSKKSTAKKTSTKTPSTKKVAKAAIKEAKKNPVGAFIVVLLVIALGVAGYFGYQWYLTNFPTTSFVLNGANAYSIGVNSEYVEKGAKATYNGVDISKEIEISYYKEDRDHPVTSITTENETTFLVDYSIDYEKMHETLSRTVTVATSAPISISFLELGNRFTGDSVYIKAGDTDILIDAGSRQSSSATIKSFLEEPGRVEDGKLEYVIATHEHQDHIAGFVGTKDAPGIFESFECGTIIDFAQCEGTSSLYRSYVEKRDASVNKGAKHFTALECYNNAKEGAKHSYDLAPGISMDILYQRFYEEKSSDINNYSVCVLINHIDNHYLFTGDLEKAGESSLVESNSLPEVTLFKGAHHGSYTANNDVLLDVIRPKTVCICCCAGSDEYTKNPLNMFPAQDAINRLGKHTEQIYVTTLDDGSGGFAPMNGTITCTSVRGGGLTDFVVHGSHNDIILKDTDWFKANRTWPTA